MSELTEAEKDFIANTNDVDEMLHRIEKIIHDRETALLDRLEKALPKNKDMRGIKNVDITNMGFNACLTSLRALIEAERKAL